MLNSTVPLASCNKSGHEKKAKYLSHFRQESAMPTRVFLRSHKMDFVLSPSDWKLLLPRADGQFQAPLMTFPRSPLRPYVKS